MLTYVTDPREVAIANDDDGQEPWFAAARRAPLLDLLETLERRGYDFVTATPSAHARVVSRPWRQVASELRDVLGWSLPFSGRTLDPEILELLHAAGALAEQPDGSIRPLLRVSRVEGTLFLHSPYPTTQHDSIFLGPDSYRFAHWIEARIAPQRHHILDYGAGAGVGGIVAALRAGDTHLTIADINEKALFLASVNAEHAGVDHVCARVTRPHDLQDRFDLVVTHPPFMIDEGRRAYRDGGDLYGAQLSLDWVMQGIDLLAPGGQLILHTGVSIVDGRDVLLEALRECLPAIGISLDYRELDPDICGEELDRPAYAEVERIAAVGAVVTKTGGA